MTREPKVGEAVQVTWIDSHGWGGWMDAEDVQTECFPIRTIGILFHEADDALTVIQSDHDGERVDNYITIPRFAVTKIRRLA